MSEWKPIETAPKDGTPVILASATPGFYPRSGWWSLAFEEWVVRENVDDGQATFLPARHLTHWMPLPDPPAPLHPNTPPQE